MSLGKFLAMVTTKSVWFSPLVDLPDRWEGHPPDTTERRMHEYLEGLGIPRTVKNAYTSGHVGVRGIVLRTHIVSCWREAATESSVMWGGYAPGEGVVIQTTFGRLRDSIASTRDFYVAQVKYIDHATYDVDEPNDYVAVAFLKRPQYAEEREVRALIDRGDLFIEDGSSRPMLIKDPGSPGGERVPTDLRKLIIDVRTSPGSAAWLSEAIEKVIEVYKYRFLVRKSELDAEPPAGPWGS